MKIVGGGDGQDYDIEMRISVQQLDEDGQDGEDDTPTWSPNNRTDGSVRTRWRGQGKVTWWTRRTGRD